MLRNLYETLRLKLAVRDYNLYETLRLKLAVRDHNTKHKKRVLEVMPSGAELDAIQALRATGTNSQTRIRQAAQLEAHSVPETYFQLMLSIYQSQHLLADDLNLLAEQGIRFDGLKPSYRERIQEAARSIDNMGRIHRLQHAVERLAFIAGPGFTTQQLIDDGLIKEGDL